MEKKSDVRKARLFSKLDFPDRMALWLAFLAMLVLSELLTYKYYSLGYYDWDLALYSQAMWNLVHGSFYSSLLHINFLANHAEYISFFLIPVYALFQHPLTLVFLKIFSYVVGSFVLYLIAKKSMPPVLAILFMFLYLTFPANIYAMLYEFHFESLNIGLLFLMFYFFRERRFVPFCFTMFFMGLIKENMPPIIVAFGIYSLFVKNRDKLRWSVVPIVFGGALFYISMFLITPLLRTSLGSANQYIGLYHALGTTPFEIIKTFFMHPQEVLAIIFKPYNLRFLKELLSPLAFLSVFSPHILFMGSPVFLQNLLSSAGQQHTILYHYTATLTPFIFLAAAESLRLIRARVKPFYYYVIYLIMLLFCINNFGFYRADFAYRISKFSDPLTPVRWQMIHKIPSDQGVIASLSFLAPLSQRQSLYSYLNVLNGSMGLSAQKFELPKDVHYALVDLEDLWVLDEIFAQPENAVSRVNDFLSKGWKIQDIDEDIVLLNRSPGHGFEWVEHSFISSLPKATEQTIVIDDSFRLLDYGITPEQPHYRSVLLNFSWFAEKDIGKNYKLEIIIKENGKIVKDKIRRIGYTVYPTIVWKKGDLIREKYRLCLPQLSEGKYSVEVIFRNFNDKRSGQLKPAKFPRSELPPYEIIVLGEFEIPKKRTRSVGTQIR